MGSPAILLVSYLLLSVGSALDGNLRLPVGVPLVLAAFGLAWFAAASLSRSNLAKSLSKSLSTSPSTSPSKSNELRGISPDNYKWLYAGLSLFAGLLATSDAGPFPEWMRTLIKGYALLAIVLIGVHAGGDDPWRRRAFWAMVIPALVIPFIAPYAQQRPFIDVWEWSQECSRALLRGVHPYTVIASDIYEGTADYGYRTTVYPYPPLDISVTAIGVALFGDYRYLLAACHAAAFFLARAAGRRLSVDARVLDVTLLCLALHPRATFLITLGWKEPLLECAVAAFFYLQIRWPGGASQAIAFFCLPSLKQYVIAPVLLYLARPPRRAFAIGLAFSAIVLLPFVLWNARATVDGLLFQMRAPIAFRTDSVSLTALIAWITGWRAPRMIGAVAQLVAAVPAYLLLRRHGTGGLLLSSALALCASFLLGSQSFLNYYYFVGSLLLLSALSFAAPSEPA